ESEDPKATQGAQVGARSSGLRPRGASTKAGGVKGCHGTRVGARARATTTRWANESSHARSVVSRAGGGVVSSEREHAGRVPTCVPLAFLTPPAFVDAPRGCSSSSAHRPVSHGVPSD